ncbi:cyclic nucleotide-binding domain-containing protein [Coraliomargarita sp. W4R72]
MNPISSRIRSLLLITALAGLIFIMIGSLTPNNLHQVQLDKWVHAIGYGLLGILITTGLPFRFYLPGYAFVFFVGAMLEVAQKYVLVGRSFDWHDLLANFLGLTVGSLLGLLICRVWSQLRREVISVGERRRRRIYLDGETVFRYGDASDDFYVIQQGSVRLLDADGNEFALAGTEEVLGEMGVIECLPRSATAIAVGETILYRLSREDLEQTIEGREHPALLVARVLAKRLRDTNDLLHAQTKPRA